MYVYLYNGELIIYGLDQEILLAEHYGQFTPPTTAKNCYQDIPAASNDPDLIVPDPSAHGPDQTATAAQSLLLPKPPVENPSTLYSVCSRRGP